MSAIDIDNSIGEKSASDDEDLHTKIEYILFKTGLVWQDGPHTHKVLHHELVQCFRRMRHVDFALSIFEIRLPRREETHMRHAGGLTFSIM